MGEKAMTFYQFANMIKGYAIAVGVAVAIGYVWMWWQHRSREHKQDRGAKARSVYRAYLQSALQHPELSEPVLGGPADMVRYNLFVASLLTAADEILLVEPNATWRETLLRQMAPHRSLLTSREFQETTYRDCTPEVRALIDRLGTGGAGRVMTYPDGSSRLTETPRQSGLRANTG